MCLTPCCVQVVGALLDCEAPDEFINNLILSVRSLLPVDTLVDQVEKRNRLKLLTPFLEHLIREGSTDPHVHDALGKIIIDTNNNPEHFLTTNPYYDSLVSGCDWWQLRGRGWGWETLQRGLRSTDYTCTMRWLRSSSTATTTRSPS